VQLYSVTPPSFPPSLPIACHLGEHSNVPNNPETAAQCTRPRLFSKFDSPTMHREWQIETAEAVGLRMLIADNQQKREGNHHLRTGRALHPENLPRLLSNLSTPQLSVPPLPSLASPTMLPSVRANGGKEIQPRNARDKSALVLENFQAGRSEKRARHLFKPVLMSNRSPPPPPSC
jgi:hypothetical protein